MNSVGCRSAPRNALLCGTLGYLILLGAVYRHTLWVRVFSILAVRQWPIFYIWACDIQRPGPWKVSNITTCAVVCCAKTTSSQLAAGGAIGVSVDVSGDGRLPTSASIPGSTLPTAFISLNIFLISSQTNTNITVTSGPQFLGGEQGSTVKHLNFAIPSCLKSGDYNVGFVFRLTTELH